MGRAPRHCETKQQATVDFEAQDEAVLAKILVPAGTPDVACGTPMMVLIESTDDVAAFKDFSAGAAEAPAPAAEAVAKAEAPAPKEQASAPGAAPSAAAAGGPAQGAAPGARVAASPLAKLVSGGRSCFACACACEEERGREERRQRQTDTERERKREIFFWFSVPAVRRVFALCRIACRQTPV